MSLLIRTIAEMPRRARHFVPNAIFHAGARGVDRQPIFFTDQDRSQFIEKMAAGLAAAGCHTAAFALMPNHFHWEVITGETPFEAAFHDAMLSHAVRFNRLYGRTGHLFEARHWSYRCEGEHIENSIAYIHLNPERGGLVQHPAEWRWSSYREWADGATRIVDLERLSTIAGVAVADLRSRHEARIRFMLQKGPKGLKAEELVRDIASMLGISADKIVQGARGGLFTLAKQKLIDRCAEENISIDELSRALHCTREAVYLARKRRN